MNEHRVDFTDTESSKARRAATRRKRLVYLGSCVVGTVAGNVLAVSAVSVNAAARNAEVALSVPDQLKASVEVNPVEPDIFDDLTVIRLDNPNDGFVTGEAAQRETIEQFRLTTDIIADASDGAIFPASEIHAVKIEAAPEGRVYSKSGEAYDCYPADQLKEVKQQVVDLVEVPDDAMIAVSMESDAYTCGIEQATAYVGGSVGAGGGVYHRNILRNDEHSRSTPIGAHIESSVTLHEIGHSVGLNHVGKMQLPNNVWYPDDNTDIAQWIKSGAQYVGLEEEAHDKHASIDMYAGKGTVMGSLHSVANTREGNIPYNFIERQRLNPAVESVEVIENSEAVDIPISLDGLKRGIRLPLPNSHPLRTIEGGAPLESVEIGIDFLYGHADFATINTFVTNEKDESFEISLSRSKQIFGKDKPELHKELTELYRDTDLGLTVSVMRENDNYREAVLQVRPIEGGE